MPTSIVLQFCLIITSALSLTMVVSWALLLTVMAVPYVFAGVVVSLALTPSPFPTGQLYGVDLLGAALGCVAVLVLLNGLDGPTAVIVAASSPASLRLPLPPALMPKTGSSSSQNPGGDSRQRSWSRWSRWLYSMLYRLWVLAQSWSRILSITGASTASTKTGTLTRASERLGRRSRLLHWRGRPPTCRRAQWLQRLE